MVRVVALMLVVAALQAQTPPPEVDVALRSRITQFYQLEIQGKYRQAEQIVAEDTQDLFVGASKPSFYAFQILSIKYADDFKTAEVVTLVSRQVPVEGFMGRPLTSKMPTRWKLENGQWCYYVDPKKDLPSSPFGMPVPGLVIPKMAGAPASMPVAQAVAPPAVKPTPPPVAPPPAPTTPPPAATPSSTTVTPGMPVPAAVPIATAPGARPLPPMPSVPPIPSVLTVDKMAVQFKIAAPFADQVVITNPTPFSESLMLTDPKIAGLSVKLDRLSLQSRDKATLSIEWKGGTPPPRTTIVVKVPQTNQVIPIAVTFAK